jgi:hypothetical protein
LFGKTVAKLREYEIEGDFRILVELISDLCLRERSEDRMVSYEEVSSYFAFGLAQGRVFDALIWAQRKNVKSTTVAS